LIYQIRLFHIHNKQHFIPAFDLKFFKDSNFTENYDSNSDSQFFEIQKVGRVGITSDAKVTLSINENTPENLYYKLIPIYKELYLKIKN
jgi:hypothetical protein